MITVHHLNNSRSQRILWLLEELGVPYEVERYERDPQTQRAPQSLEAVHPLGKSPVITDGDTVVSESGAIVEYLVETHGKGRLGASPGSPQRKAYLEWLHYVEGSAMVPFLFDLIVTWFAGKESPILQFVEPEIEKQVAYLEGALEGRDHLLGDFSAADVLLSFVLEFAEARGRLKERPALRAYLRRLQERPAYKRALERGGPYDLAVFG